MRLLDLYYLVKPAIPRPVRFKLRQFEARRRLSRCGDVWPISQTSAKIPAGWPGWPDGKKFAFVLTHDVEGTRGLERCTRLAEMEMKFGFRSSFNLVPEGEYSATDAVRGFLTQRGFEVGVHDLHHNGTLYKSAETFRQAAVRINSYLKSWGAVGFRSAFMFHNLEWLQQLDVLYDASTFDIDPFEPQPDGANTIFPFWVARKDGSGFVELPYTLAQDSTMFLVLRQKDTEIWKTKLDWVAAHGGLALVNVHPDYMAFDGAVRSTEFPSALYSDFLDYVRRRYASEAWCALPRDVAAYLTPHFKAPGSGARRVLEVVQ
jgi:hypothetical protein